MWESYISASTVDEVIQLVDQLGQRARIVAGATDLILELERGQRTGIDTLVDITRVPGLDEISLDEDGIIHLGALVTHNQCVASPLIRKRAYPLAKAAWEVGSPQIRNRGTIAGNLITASPANDTITPLMALGAIVLLRSRQGDRMVQLDHFYTGVRKTVMRPNEMLVEIQFPAMLENQSGTFIKYALRRAQAISLVNLALVATLDGNRVHHAAITLGAVAPTIIHARKAEEYLFDIFLETNTISKAASLVQEAADPISDVRASASYRRAIAGVIAKRALNSLLPGNEMESFPEQPVLLGGQTRPIWLSQSIKHDGKTPIVTHINGKTRSFSTGHEKTLLRLIREEGGLIGSKEGCAEGECGACTVFLDGQAVMSCMVPAPRAHLAEIITIEGLAEDGDLHPVQQGFMDAGAVQCGYCTPGFIMSAVKLLEEKPVPNQNDIRNAFTGNLCRCTGYYKIIEAVERASRR